MEGVSLRIDVIRYGQSTRGARSGKALTHRVTAGWKRRGRTGNFRSLLFLSASIMESFDIEEILLDDGVLEMGDQEKFDVPSSTADSFSGVCLETLEESCNALLSDDCISDSTKDIIRNIDGPALLQDLQFLNQCLVKKGRFKTAAKEKAYSNFNREFVNHSQDVERHIPSPASAWVCLKVFELMVNKNYNLPLCNQASSISEVTDDEVDIVQYIAGYVLRSVKRRALKLSHTEREDSLLCIKELIPEDDTASEPAERSLTQILDTGGLIKLKPPVLQVFIKLESIFRQCFDGQVQTLSFDLYFTNCCQAESVSTCLYEQMYSILATQKIKENILFMIVKSYFMVRAHHKCKKFMENCQDVPLAKNRRDLEKV
ncbi:uncharacterized protein LOC112571862 [Pomacea canaliculata]|uniref:uncharacterized protein LOC112571862 n=1 Tax=Pomacea canaliculata TaxID=400727 RepID=UPI000D73FCB2|nr:uncharacterized protein LOC112571862 [Pomacea canaliculata]